MSNSTFTNGFEGGTNGSAVGTASAGGTAFTASDAAVVYTTAFHAHGSLGASCSGNTSTGNNVVRWALASEPIAKLVGYFNFSGLATADYDFMNLRITGDTSVVGARINSVGKLRLVSLGTVIWTATNTIPTNQAVRVELYANIGSSTTTGTLRLAYFLGDSTTAVEDSGTLSAVNAGDGTTNTYVNARYGKTNSAAFSFNLSFDDVAAYTGTNALLGTAQPASSPPAPTIVGGSKQVLTAGGSTVNVTCTATPGTGASISSYQWTAVSWPAGQSAPTITSPTAQTASFTPQNVQGRWLFNVTATDNFGQTTAPAVVEVDVAGPNIAPIAVTANSGWTVGAVTDGTDASDATYYESGAPGSNSILVLRLAPLVSNGTSFPLDVRDLVQAVSGTQKVELVEGATTTSDGTVRKNWGGIGPGTSFADQILTLTSGEMATITDWTNLHLRLTQV